MAGTFGLFVEKVLGAARKGGLNIKDVKKLERLFSNTGKRNMAMAQGLLTALNAGGAKKDDIKELAKLLENANTNIETGKKPFSKSDEDRISGVFKRAGLPEATRRWVVTQMDEFVSTEISETLAKREGPKRVVFDIQDRKQKITA